jgi:glycosyltransferase involved in cell wall biosynthesis
MHVLALEPFYAGSHRQFLDHWIAVSRHAWTWLTLPGRKWKWRMRHAPVTFAEELVSRAQSGEAWDIIFCSSMLNLAEFRGLAPPSIASLPAVVYFHENQFTYPNRIEQERDLHFGFINLTTALAAEAVWFNSAYHRQDFLAGAKAATRKMPDYRLDSLLPPIEAKSSIQHPGVVEPAITKADLNARVEGPLHLLWAARWEHDKQPEIFFEALHRLREWGVPFRLSVVGEQYEESPPVFATAREAFADQIVRWGYQPTRASYERALAEADVAVSTAGHEFFGISAVETLLAGLWPLWPDRLTYPELLSVSEYPEHARHLYAGDAASLARAIQSLAQQLEVTGQRPEPGAGVRTCGQRFLWAGRGSALDAALEGAAGHRVPDFQPF